MCSSLAGGVSAVCIRAITSSPSMSRLVRRVRKQLNVLLMMLLMLSMITSSTMMWLCVKSFERSF